MKIVIIGEFSSFAKNLSYGFKALGHTCIVFSWGDGFKRIEADNTTYKIAETNSAIFGKTIRGSHFFKSPFLNIILNRYLKKLSREKADVILVTNMVFLRKSNSIFNKIFHVRFSYKMLCSIVKDKSNIYMSSCGNDYIVNRYLPQIERPNEYAIFKFNKNINEQKRQFELYVTHINKIIPIAYDYEKAYRFFSNSYDFNIYKTIPLPYNTSSVDSFNYLNGKISILHGINRPYEKGSYIILCALEKLKKQYAEKIDVNIVYQLPLNEYLKIMSKANIVIDQCYGLSNGMNTIEALSMGKVVLTGNNQDYQKMFTRYPNPVIDIKPNSDQIYNVLEDLVLHPQKIEDISIKSREYAVAVHDSKVVANQYIEIFNQSA